MLQIGETLAAHVAVEKGYVISSFGGFCAKAVEVGGKIFMQKAAALKLCIEDAYIICSVGL